MNKQNRKTPGKRTELNEDFKFEIINHLGILSTSNSGWNKEVNVVKWNDANPKVDIREWDSEHEKMSRGTSLNINEVERLKELLDVQDFSVIIPS